MGSSKLTAARVREIYQRQKPGRFGPLYKAAQRAVRGEAPSLSEASPMHSDRLQRQVHALSQPESAAVPVALHHPLCFEMLDQHALSVTAQRHPMHGHPKAKTLSLPTTSGTLAIAERLQVLHLHPRVLEVDPRSPTKDSRWIPAPWLGDLLLFMTDDAGPYCVSWDIKRNPGDHGKPGPRRGARLPTRKDILKADAREAVYVEYMRELGIRIVRIHLGTFDEYLVANLRRLLEMQTQTIDLPPQVHADAVLDFQRAMQGGRPPSVVIEAYRSKGFDRLEIKRVLAQAIWQRHIRIDLFRPWSVDVPLMPELRDPLVEYADCFRR